MTADSTDFSYVLARLHARHGARAKARDWSRLEPYRDFRGYLDAVRATPLAPHVAGLTSESGLHVVESHIRAAWWRGLDTIGAWHGAAFQPAFARLAAQALLPAWLHRARAARADGAPDWMPGWLDEAVSEAPAPGDSAAESAHDRMPRWRDAFLASLPDSDLRPVVGEALDEIMPPGSGFPDAWRLDAVGDRLFHRARAPFARVLGHLGCLAADLLRLRGELCLRLALPGIDLPADLASGMPTGAA